MGFALFQQPQSCIYVYDCFIFFMVHVVSSKCSARIWFAECTLSSWFSHWNIKTVFEILGNFSLKILEIFLNFVWFVWPPSRELFFYISFTLGHTTLILGIIIRIKDSLFVHDRSMLCFFYLKIHLFFLYNFLIICPFLSLFYSFFFCSFFVLYLDCNLKTYYNQTVCISFTNKIFCTLCIQLVFSSWNHIRFPQQGTIWCHYWMVGWSK